MLSSLSQGCCIILIYSGVGEYTINGLAATYSATWQKPGQIVSHTTSLYNFVPTFDNTNFNLSDDLP